MRLPMMTNGVAVMMDVPKLERIYGNRIRFHGCIEGVQSQRTETPAQPTTRSRSRPLNESPDVWVLQGEHWQFFGTLNI
jgi:hypothetical protein